MERTADAVAMTTTSRLGRRNQRNIAATKQARNEIMQSVDKVRDQLARHNWIERYERSDKYRRVPTHSEVNRDCKDGEECCHERNPWSGFGNFDIMRCFKQSKSYIPGTFRVIAQPVLEMRNEAVQRIVEWIPTV